MWFATVSLPGTANPLKVKCFQVTLLPERAEIPSPCDNVESGCILGVAVKASSVLLFYTFLNSSFEFKSLLTYLLTYSDWLLGLELNFGEITALESF
jgi:hypothetical protein